MLLRLVCLGLTNTFALLRLLPMSNQDKDTEILVLRHQIALLQRQLGGARPRFTPGDRALLAALLYRLPRQTLHRLRLLVRPDTILRWHRDLLRRRHARVSRPTSPGRPRTIRSIRVLVLRFAKENPSWGYRRIHGELLVLGIKVAASTVWQILTDARVDPAPERASSTWAQFLRSQAEALLACDFFDTVTLAGTRMYVLAVIEHAQRRIRILGATPHPTAAWVAQAARNLLMDLDDVGCRARFMIRDRDGKFPALFDAVLADAGIQVVLAGIQMSRMNSIMERWVQTCRHELLDRALIWTQRHLLHALGEYERFYNSHRPHQGIANARPLRPTPTTDHQYGPDHPSQHPPATPSWRDPQRIPPCRLTSTDDIFGKRKRTGRAEEADLLRRFGFEPDGSTTQPWDTTEVTAPSNETTPAAKEPEDRGEPTNRSVGQRAASARRPRT